MLTTYIVIFQNSTSILAFILQSTYRYHFNRYRKRTRFVSLKGTISLQKSNWPTTEIESFIVRLKDNVKTLKLNFLIANRIWFCVYSYLSVKASLTFWGSFEALVLGYINGASVSTRRRSRGITLSSRIFRTPSSDLSFHR